ncbi:MAG: SRPBCC family protein [Nitrospirota bacterium]|nr:SRPBCC family protein [Nitrospirota bacterium]
MTQVSVTETIEAPADAVWNTVRGFGNMDKVLPEMVAKCEVTGSGAGATRLCTFHDGMKLNERLESVDEAGCAITYSIEDNVMPFNGYLSTVRVRDAGGGKTEVNWSSTFSLNGITEAEATGMLEGVYRTGIGQLQRINAQTPAEK